MSVQSRVTQRGSIPPDHQETDVIEDDEEISSNHRCWNFCGSEQCISDAQENVGMAGVRDMLDLDACGATRLCMNILVGGGLIVTNSLYLANVNQREQGLQNCRQSANCTSGHYSYATDLVLKSGVAPQETASATTGILAGVSVLSYGLVKIGMLLLNKYRDL